MRMRPRGVVIWLGVLTIVNVVIVVVGLGVKGEASNTDRRTITIVRETDPCSRDLHGHTCMLRTCIRLADVGYALTKNCDRLLSEAASGKLPGGPGVRLKGVIAGGGSSNPSGQPGRPRGGLGERGGTPSAPQTTTAPTAPAPASPPTPTVPICVANPLMPICVDPNPLLPR